MFLQSLIILYAGFSLFGTNDTLFISYFIIIITITVLLSFLCYPLRNNLSDRLYRQQVRMFASHSVYRKFRIQKLDVFLLFVLLVSIGYIISIGVPGFQSDAASAKLRVNSNPLLSRFIRILLPVTIVIYGSKFEALPNKTVLAVIFLILLSTGFKGYIISYFMIPIMLVLFYLNKLKFKTILLLLLTMVLLLYLSIWLALGINNLDFLSYIFLRATVSQSESILLVLSNLDVYEKFPVFSASFLSVFNRFGFEFVSLNERLFTDLHGNNPYRMQLAIPAALEIYLKFGLTGVFVFIALFLVLIIYLERKMGEYFRKKCLLKLSFTFIILIFSLDFFSNGNIASKLIDMLLSSIYFALMYYVFSFKFWRSYD